jgi:hypothetical protein
MLQVTFFQLIFQGKWPEPVHRLERAGKLLHTGSPVFYHGRKIAGPVRSRIAARRFGLSLPAKLV